MKDNSWFESSHNYLGGYYWSYHKCPIVKDNIPFKYIRCGDIYLEIKDINKIYND